MGLATPARPSKAARDVLRGLSEHISDLARNPPDEELDADEVLGIEESLEDLQAHVHRFVHLLHPFVAFLVMSAFALANSGVALGNASMAKLATPVTLGTATGLFVGMQLGIFVTTLAAVKLGLAPMPGDVSRAKLFGVSVLAGIGFTVSLFVAAPAYPEAPNLLDGAKVGVLLGSRRVALGGYPSQGSH